MYECTCLCICCSTNILCDCRDLSQAVNVSLLRDEGNWYCVNCQPQSGQYMYSCVYSTVYTTATRVFWRIHEAIVAYALGIMQLLLSEFAITRW